MHQIKITEDGSSTIYVEELDEHYHSTHGAIQESQHIFINAGLKYYLDNNARTEIHILEAGFGTGLNAYLSFIEASKSNIKLIYHSIEKYPLNIDEAKQLNYPKQVQSIDNSLFEKFHSCQWNKEIELHPNFSISKHQKDLKDINFENQFDLIYFDAFSLDTQAELWTETVFKKYHKALTAQGILLTYCVKGIVKQALRNVGFSIKRLPGPPGKRQILRAIKTCNDK